jgi:hypothetical protein
MREWLLAIAIALCIWFVVVLAVQIGDGAAKDAESVGQIKAIRTATPVFCPNYTETNISLGAIVDGMGSMSKEDITLEVPSQALAEKLKESLNGSGLVKIRYDKRLVTFCVPKKLLKDVEVITNGKT